MPEIVGVSVAKYKNLKDVWLPWSDGLALFGVNGSGKTNLLECLALLFGEPQTMRLARPRLGTAAPNALSCVVRVDKGSLPWPPDVVLPYAERMGDETLVSRFPFLARTLSDAAWWAMIGSSGGEDFDSGVMASQLSPELTACLGGITNKPVIDFSLTSFDYLDDAGRADTGAVQRTFARTLMAPEVPPALSEMAEHLPDAFSPLRSYLTSHDDGHREGWVPVLALPPVTAPPATLQWLPRGRTGDEVNQDLLQAFQEAAPSASWLSDALETLPLAHPPEDQDWHWWLHELGQRRGAEELSLTLPGVSIVAAGADDADFALFAEASTEPVELGHTGDAQVLEFFSSGERRWVDEALATVARELRRFGQQAGLHTERFFDLDDDTVMAAVLHVAGAVDDSLLREGFWTGETFDLLLSALEPALVAAERAYAVGEDVIDAALKHHSSPGLSLLEPQPVVRVFDEPEAHMHPSAQRRLASALDTLRRRGDNVVVASHSPHFLDLEGWTLVHVQQGPDGAQAQPLPRASALARHSLARQLGVNRGELLAGINGILIVEGKHDQLVLQRLYGAELRSAGLALVRMFGTDNLMATSELDFLDQYLDVPITILLDYTRVERVEAGKPVTEEEKKLLHLRRSCRRRKRDYHLVGLDRPDVVCYLSESAVKELHPSFPGWQAVVSTFERQRFRPRFKEWLYERYAVDLRYSTGIEAVLERMEASSHRPVGELTLKMNEVVSHLAPAHLGGSAGTQAP